jgi:hypothetical protein
MNKDFTWVRQCIQSSTNAFHLDSCHTILYLYKQKYPDLKDDYETLLLEIEQKEVSISVDA